MSTAGPWSVHLEMPSDVILSELISQSGELADQVLELVPGGVGVCVTEFGGLDLCRWKNLILSAPPQS